MGIKINQIIPIYRLFLYTQLLISDALVCMCTIKIFIVQIYAHTRKVMRKFFIHLHNIKKNGNHIFLYFLPYYLFDIAMWAPYIIYERILKLHCAFWYFHVIFERKPTPIEFCVCKYSICPTVLKNAPMFKNFQLNFEPSWILSRFVYLLIRIHDKINYHKKNWRLLYFLALACIKYRKGRGGIKQYI